MRAAGKHSGIRDGESRDVCDGVQIGSAVAVTNPKTLLAGTLKAGIIPLAFRAERVNALETQAISINGKTVIIGDGLVLCTAAVFLAVVPVFVAAGTFAGFGLAEGAAEFLAGTIIVGGFAIQIKLPAGRALLLELRFLRGIKASPS